MKRTSRILAIFVSLVMAAGYFTVAQAAMISIGDAAAVTEAWNPSKRLADNSLSPEQKQVLANAHKAHKDRLDKIWFTFKDTYFMSVEHKGCDDIRRGTSLKVTNIIVFNQTGTIVDTGVNFALPNVKNDSDDAKNCLAFVVRP